MTQGGPHALVLATAVPALLLAAVGLVGLVRWRARNGVAADEHASRLTRVSRTLRRGGTVSPEDRPAGVLVVERCALMAPVLLSPLLLGVGQIARAVLQPDDSVGVVLVAFVVSVAVSVAGLALCARALVVAQRQGIRPRRLW